MKDPQWNEIDRGAAIAEVKAHNAALPTPPRAYVLTFGCQQNEADSEKIRALADRMGFLRAERAEDASLIVVNTCAIREHAEQKALSVIGSYKHLKEADPDLVIGVCGCMTAQESRVEQLKSRYPYVSFTTEPSAIGDIPAVLAEIYRKKRRYFLREVPDSMPEGIPALRDVKHRAWLTIMAGCNNFCSYCIVPYVRGRERSRKSADILAEARELIASGAKDITLLGQNVNSYRGDCDFPALVRQIDALDGDFVLRFMTSHPKDVSDGLIRAIAEGRHIEKHFHLPLQSGSDRVLHAMNRHYDMAHYLSVVEKLRAAVPEIALTSDIIVGFPGETEEEFAETLAVMEQVKFDSVYSFIYSPRKGTPAAAMAEQIPPEIQGDRMNRLLDLQGRICLEKNLPYVGRDERVLIDGAAKTGEGIYSGRTSSGKLVHVEANEEDVGFFRTVHIDKAEAFALFGTVKR